VWSSTHFKIFYVLVPSYLLNKEVSMATPLLPSARKKGFIARQSNDEGVEASRNVEQLSPLL
jgi:hypothetical protein